MRNDGRARNFFVAVGREEIQKRTANFDRRAKDGRHGARRLIDNADPRESPDKSLALTFFETDNSLS